jgi:hypothetical protein
MTFDPQGLGIFGSARYPPELTIPFRALGLAISTGMKFDDGSTKGLRCFKLAHIGFNKQGYANFSCIQFCNERCEMIMRTRGIQSALGRPLLAFFRHDAGSMRRMTQRYRKHLIGRRHLQVQRQVYPGAQAGDIVIGHMAPVFAQMRRYTVGTGRRRSLRCTDRIRMLSAARIPDRRDMIDIDAKS